MTLQNGDIITIDNYASKVSQFDPTLLPLFALVDIGSNGIRFSISDLSEPRSRLLPCVYRERRGISLYDALHESTPDSIPFHFSPAVIASVAQTLKRFRFICDQYGVPLQNVSVFATEAMRTAQNKDDMLAAIRNTSGLKVDILSSTVESLFGAMGARSGFNRVDGLFMDLGGGSVQMTYIDSLQADYDALAARAAQSMPFGAAKLTDAMSSKSQSLQTQQDLQNVVRRSFNGLQSQFPKLKAQAASADGITIYFCGGGFRGYGSMLMHTHKTQPYPVPNIGGFVVSGSVFADTKSMLKANEQKCKVFGMSKKRRQQFPAIVLVIEALLQAIPQIKKVVFCSGGNREGVLFMKLPPSIRESNPIRMCPGILNEVFEASETSIKAIAGLLSKSLPDISPSVFKLDLLEYAVRNNWVSMGESDSMNSSRALHNPISGPTSALPGHTHESRVVIALMMCSRWNSELAPADKPLYNNLRQLVGPVISFFADYIGTIARLLAAVSPAFPGDIEVLEKAIALDVLTSFHPSTIEQRSLIRLRVRLGDAGRVGIDERGIELMFEKVGKGLDIDLRIEVSFIR